MVTEGGALEYSVVEPIGLAVGNEAKGWDIMPTLVFIWFIPFIIC